MRMAEHSELHAFIGHENPTILRTRGGLRRKPRDRRRLRSRRGGGLRPRAGDRHRDGQRRRAAGRPGVVDALLAQGTRAVGPTRAGAEIEWNKVFARSLLGRGGARRPCPMLRVVTRPGTRCAEAIESFGSTPVAVKPAGLTGGKGVKVMGPHLAEPRRRRATTPLSLLARGGGRGGADRGEGQRRRVHDPGDQRRAHGRVPALDLRLPLPLRRRRGAGHRRHGLAVDARADAALHDGRPLRAGVLDHRAA